MKKLFFITLLALILTAISFFFEKNIPQQKVIISNSASTGAHAFLEAVKKQIGRVTSYDQTNGYYGNGGFPPADTGVCSDVLWRAYAILEKDFRTAIINNIHQYPDAYENPGDANIAFRRVKTIFTYLTRHAQSLTLSMIPNNGENLSLWQEGDIVVFDELPSNHLWHIGVISDVRRDDGVPYMIDNHGYGVSMRITPLDWPTPIIGHFRVF